MPKVSFNMKVPKELKAEIKKEAKRRGESPSGTARDILSAYFYYKKSKGGK